MRLGSALDAILRLVVAGRRHELSDVVYATTGARAGIVVHNLPNFEIVIAQTIPSIAAYGMLRVLIMF
jgi:hypothetical protein